jgi:hypothetical protein
MYGANDTLERKLARQASGEQKPSANLRGESEKVPYGTLSTALAR